MAFDSGVWVLSKLQLKAVRAGDAGGATSEFNVARQVAFREQQLQRPPEPQYQGLGVF